MEQPDYGWSRILSRKTNRLRKSYNQHSRLYKQSEPLGSTRYPSVSMWRLWDMAPCDRAQVHRRFHKHTVRIIRAEPWLKQALLMTNTTYCFPIFLLVRSGLSSDFVSESVFPEQDLICLLFFLSIFLYWRCSQYAASKRRWTCVGLHGTMSQRTATARRNVVCAVLMV